MTHISAVRKLTTSRLVEAVDRSLQEARIVRGLDANSGFYTIEGMSGKLYRFFINTLVRQLGDAAYLEVGSWAGSTLCSAIHDNKVRAVAIDNWSQFGGPKDLFFKNLRTFTTPGARPFRSDGAAGGKIGNALGDSHFWHRLLRSLAPLGAESL